MYMYVAILLHVVAFTAYVGSDFANFCLHVFCKNICHPLCFTKKMRTVIFFPTKFLSNLSKLQRCCRPASEKDKFLSSIKTDKFVNSHALISRLSQEMIIRLPNGQYNYYISQNIYLLATQSPSEASALIGQEVQCTCTCS